MMVLPYRLAERLGSNARIVLLRLVSIGLGGLVVLVVYAAGRTLAPQRAELAPLAAGLVAFIPMHTAMTATISNDTLAELLASATLLAILLGLRHGFGARGALALGTLGGGLLLTKVTVYVFLPLALLALAFEAGAPLAPAKPFRLGRAAGRVGLALAVAAALAGWWFLRDLAVYGWPDLFGLLRHEQVVVGQPRWSGLAEEPVRFFLYSTFRSFWAQFGWMAVVVDPRLYGLFLLFLLLVLGGLRRFWRAELPAWPPPARIGLGFLLAGLGLVTAEVVGYNLTFIQAQGRYLYPAILPLGLLFGLGWSALAEVSPGASGWRWLGFGLGFYWLWAAGLEALSWLIAQGPAPLVFHLLTIGPTWLATKVQIRRPRESLAGIAAVALLVVLVLIDAACLLRFVMPYFQGW